MTVKFIVYIGYFLGVVFKEIRVNELEIVGIDLFPPDAGAVLPEINKLCEAVGCDK